MDTRFKTAAAYGTSDTAALIRQSGIDALAQGEAALAYATRQVLRYDRLCQMWRDECLSIMARNGEIRDALKRQHPRLELAPSTTFEFEEDCNYVAI